MGYFSQLLERHSSVYRWRLALSTRIPPFSSQHLEAACRVLADTERGLSGNQIGYLLQDIRIPDADASNTKWKRLFNALAQMQNQHQVGNHLILFINSAMNPVSYARDREAFIWRRDELNVVLAFSGFYVRDDGKVGRADKATTLDVARARVGRLKAALEARAVHEEVVKYCRAELLSENYFHAVFEATKGIAARIRNLSGLNGDGADLVTKAFLGQIPVLAVGPLATESEKSEQKGFANLLIGLFGAVRNPLAHATKIDWPMSEQDALDILTMVSLMHRKLDVTRKINP
jgi:uncharacterized protein (TIGR02391 family)